MIDLHKLSSWLTSHSISHSLTENGISCESTKDDGFDVYLEQSESEVTVSYNGWHVHFSDSEDAESCFKAGFTDEVRLVEHKRGNSPYKWRLEILIDGKWEHYSTTGLLFFPIWKRHTKRTLQNAYATRS